MGHKCPLCDGVVEPVKSGNTFYNYYYCFKCKRKWCIEKTKEKAIMNDDGFKKWDGK